MKQDLALKILLTGENVLLTGAAGSGKTYVLNQFISKVKESGKSVAVTATTGLAATHLGGCTIHSWAGIGINDFIKPGFFETMPKSRANSIKLADVLIIDEVSMLHDFRLDMIDEVTRTVRGKNEPFGGIQVVLCGDFFQLPPINNGDDTSGFIVESLSFKELDPNICYLEDQYRQDDEKYLSILNAIRNNEIEENHIEELNSKIGFPFEDTSQITELHTRNVDVDTLNNKRLDLIKEEEHTFESKISGKANYKETLKKSCLAKETLTLKVGSLVMCLKNNQERRFVNGSLGKVIGFDAESSYPIVKLQTGKTVTVSPDIWELKDGEKKLASLEQVPLRLAWAITIHKSQGMTLDSARIDLRRCFVPGMGYVALSRIKNLDGLSLVGLNSLALKVSDEALRINESFLKQSKVDERRFKEIFSKG